MPNDLKTQRNLLNSRPESRPESRSESQRQKLASSGFTASIWTLSGVVLVACSNVEDFLGLDDGGGGGGGGTLHVHSSPVQGARIYFDVDEDGVISPEERAAQDAFRPEGFISDENGDVRDIPSHLYGTPFIALLDGAFDTDTGETFPDNSQYRSIPDENDQHTLASPITEYIAGQTDALAAVVARIIEIDPDADTEAAVNEFLGMVSDPTNYDGSSRIDALARYLAETATPTMADIMAFFPATTPADTLIVDTPTLPPVTIGAHDTYIGTIEVVNHAENAVSYRIVTSAGSDAFTVNERGVISVVEGGATPTTMTLRVEVRNGGEPETVSVAITVTTDLPMLTPPATTAVEMGEDTAGGTALISGIMAPSGITADDWVIRTPDAAGLASKFEIVDGTGGAFNLALKSDESLDFEALSALPDGTITLRIQAKDSDGVSSEPLELTIMVTEANEAPVFLNAVLNPDLNYAPEIAETTAIGSEVARVRAHDADGDSVTYEITDGNVALLDADGDPTGEMLFSIGGDGAITVNAPLDFDTAPTSYTLMIGVSDSLDANGDPEQTFTADATISVTIDLTDANDNAPMVTADAGTIRTTAGNTADMNTGYSITVTDADTVGSLMVTSNDRRFTFERDDPNSDTWNLVLLAGEAVTAGTISLGYTATDGANPVSGTITLTAVDTPVMFTAPATRTIPLDENNAAGAAVATVTATSSDITGSTTVHIQSFALVDSAGAPVTDGIFDITTSGLSTASASASITITDANALDYEADESHTIYVLATDTNDQTNTLRLTVNVNNVEEGEATYEIGLTDDNGATVTDLAVGVTLTPMVATDGADPDGIARVVSYLWSRGDGSSLNGDATGATYTLMAGDSTTATYSVTITYIDGTDKTEVVEASTSSVSWDVVPSYDPAANPLTDGEAPMANDPVIPMTAISASGGDGKIEYSIEDPSGVFQIHPNSGALSVSENGPAMWDFETNPSYEIYIVATDVDDGSTMGTQDTARQRVVITVQDANDAPVVEGVQVTANDPLAMAGTPTITGLTGTTADEYIKGTSGADTIASGGGADHIFGGAGNDGITLSSASGSVETIYYRFTSSDSGAWVASDGVDTITNFRRGEDRLVFLDDDGSVIDRNTFADHDNLAIRALRSGDNLTGVEILFGTTKILEIRYHSSDHVQVYESNGGAWDHAATNRYLGAIAAADVGDLNPTGYNLTTRDVATTSLLPNYFNEDDTQDNLQIVDDFSATVGGDIFISEKRNAEDGVFATVSTTDPDTDPNNQIAITRYDISGGTGSALFAVNAMGQISVSDGVNVEGGSTTLDYDTTSEYTLEITATDGGGAVSTAKTITIGLIENGEAEYSISESGTTLTADLDTADPEGLEAGSISYQWFTTNNGGTTKTEIATSGTNSISDTTSETLDVMGYTLSAGHIYGVTITYTDGVGIVETVDAIGSVAFPFEARTGSISVGFTGNFPAVNADFTATAIGGGAVTYSTGGTDGAKFEIREDSVSGEQHLYFKTTPTLTPGTLELTVIATEDQGMTTDSVAVTITVGASSPAIIPDRQAFAHQDPYEPNDDQNDQTNQDNPQTPPDIM